MQRGNESEIDKPEARHIFMIRGKIRQKSSDNQTGNKRGRTDCADYTILEAQNSPGTCEDSLLPPNVVEQQAFIDNMQQALSYDKVANLFVGLFERSISMTIKEIKNRLDTQEEAGSVRANRLVVIETRIEEYEQLRTDKTIIIPGLKQNQTSRDDVKKFLNDKLHTKTKQEDIVYTLTLTRDRGQKNRPC